MPKPYYITNLSQFPTMIGIDTRGLERYVMLPDYSPNRGKLPVGTVAVYSKEGHKIRQEYLGSDVGCGMLLAYFQENEPIDLEDGMNGLAACLIQPKKEIGQLGHGNHFVTVYKITESKLIQVPQGRTAILIHGGSGCVGKSFSEKIMTPEEYPTEQQKVLEYAIKNRRTILEMAENNLKSSAKIVMDRYHNSIESTKSSFIYRKGCIKLLPGEMSIIPSSMGGDAVIVEVNDRIRELEYTFPHATGRKISRSEAKMLPFFLDGFPENIYVPYFLSPENMDSELPQCYRTIDDILSSLEPFITICARLKPVSSIML